MHQCLSCWRIREREGGKKTLPSTVSLSFSAVSEHVINNCPVNSRTTFWTQRQRGLVNNGQKKKLKPLIEAFGVRVVASGVCFLEYFPYHSENFAHARLSLPSQTFTFDALRAAVGRGTTIIIARGRKLWEKAVPELSTHALAFETSSKQNVVISPKNCRFDALPFYKGKKPAEPPHDRPSGYEAVAAALKKVTVA